MDELTRPALQAQSASQTVSAKQTLAHLESLSNKELIDLAARYDIDIPPDLDRIFIIEELLYIEHDKHNTDQNDDVDQIEFTALAGLPKHYNVSFIEVLIRDPLWAFVFWEIKSHDREPFEADEDFSGFCLRVTPLDDDSLEPNAAAAFIIMINNDNGGLYIGFPPEDGHCFKVELCMQTGEEYTVLSASSPFRLPRLIHTPKNPETEHSPLARLSGIEHFSLIKGIV